MESHGQKQNGKIISHTAAIKIGGCLILRYTLLLDEKKN